jgi:hypothetical protein
MQLKADFSCYSIQAFLLACALLPSTLVAASGCADPTPQVDLSGAIVADCSASGLRTALSAGGTVRLSGCSMPILISPPIVINANVVFDGGGATLSGGGNNGIFVVQPLRQVHMQNLTLRDGVDDSGGFTPGGGAIRGAQFGYLTLVDMNFFNNRSSGMGGEDGGGAVLKDEGGKLTVFNSVFRDNLATNGGAIKALLSNTQIVDSSFIDNTARGGNNGGGAIFLDGLVTRVLPGYAPVGATVDGYGKGRFCGLLFSGNVVGNTLDFNTTGRQGGGLFTHTYPVTGNSTRIEIERSVFIGNRAAQDGGGLRIGTSDAGGNGGSALMSHLLLRDNRAGNHGGAIRLSDANASLENTTLVGNCAGDLAATCTSATDSGGGLGGAVAVFDRAYQAQRISVMRNRAAGFSGGLSTRPESSLSRSLIAYNNVGNSFGTTRNCGAPALLDGAFSFEWPAPQGNVFEPGCGVANISDPALAQTPTSCGENAGAASASTPLQVYLPGVVVPRVAGVPTAGAICPDQLDTLLRNGFEP